jgi:cytochrome c oxidase subunit 2
MITALTALTAGGASLAARAAATLITARPGGSVLEPAGPQAARIAHLWDLFFLVCVVVSVLIIAFTVVAAVRAGRARARLGEGEPLVRDPAQARRARGVIIACTGATVVTQIVLLVASIRTGHGLASLDDAPPALTIRVTGHQWWWQLDYRDPQPSQQFVTANELHVPVGARVELELRAADVIHSFWLPSLDGKHDLIPGRDNRATIRVDRAGTYRGQCAEFCGPQHAQMELTLVAEPAEQFAAWRARQLEAARAPVTARQVRGRELVLTTSCAMCHAISGTPAGGILGPDLTHVASRATLAAGALPNTREDLARWLLDPPAHKPGTRMPKQVLSADDLEAVLDYLESLR